MYSLYNTNNYLKLYNSSFCSHSNAYIPSVYINHRGVYSLMPNNIRVIIIDKNMFLCDL